MCETLGDVIKFTFNVKKSAQAASILLRLNGGDMEKYHLIKMLYDADREAFKRWGEPITGDDAVSMEHGPVLSAVYDLTKGERAALRDQWEPFISDADEETHRIALKAEAGDDELSDAEIRILENVHAKLKGLTWKQVKDQFHDLPEYDPTVGKSSRPIRNEKILEAVGKDAEAMRETERNLREAKLLQVAFGG